MMALKNEIGAEILKAIRAPEFIAPTLLMPCAFYALFSLVFNNSTNKSLYLLATYGVFAAMGPAIFGFGIGIATERDRGWLQLKQIAPTPAYYYIAAKLVTTMLFAACALMPIYLIAGFASDITLTQSNWVSLFAVHISSAIPFALIGLSLGLMFSTNGAIAVSNIIFLSLAIFGGLWVPAFVFSSWMQTLALFTPSYHLAELALSTVNATGEYTPITNLLTITMMSILLTVLAIWAWSKGH